MVQQAPQEPAVRLGSTGMWALLDGLATLEIRVIPAILDTLALLATKAFLELQ
jgi:hypothetical protein